jgi:hypothetical protein
MLMQRSKQENKLIQEIENYERLWSFEEFMKV